MILIEEAIDRVQSVYSKGVRSRDSRLSSRFIYAILLTTRASMIKQQSDKRQNIGHWAYQRLTDVELENIQIGGCSVLRSVQKLPKIITDSRKDLIGTITTENGLITYSKGMFETLKYRTGNKYTANTPRSYLLDGYLHITNSRLLESVVVPGLFEDPIEVYRFNNPLDLCVDYNTLEFPIDEDLMDTVAELVKNRLIVIFSQMKPDIRKDSLEDVQDKGSMIHQPNGN